MSLRNPGTDFYSELDKWQNQMDELFRTMGFSSNLRTGTRGFPPLNIGSTDDAVEVVAFAPGIDAAQLQATIDNGLLTIAGERSSSIPKDKQGVNVYARERFSGTFQRTIELPQDADPDQVQATYTDGCLRITVRKRESSKPRLITVQ